MASVVFLSQALLYSCISILIGSFLLLLVPNNYRPTLVIPTRLLTISAILVPISAFIPVLSIALYIAPRLGFFASLKLVLTTYTIGNAWSFTLLISIVLVLVNSAASRSQATEKRMFPFLSAILTFGLILSVAWSSHASSINSTMGIISDFLHLSAVCLWVGVLLIIGWCSINQSNWLKFLRWFSIVAICCLSTTAISGLFLMDVMIDDYFDSWMISYGQGLLLKHLFLLPLLFYALVNGVFVKYKLSKDATYNPLVGVRIEGFVLLTVFIITAVFSQQATPHGHYLTNDAVSPLFRFFHTDVIQANSSIGFVVNAMSVSFFFLSLLFMGFVVLAFFKKAPLVVSFLFSCLLVGTIYVMVMVTVVIR